MRYFQDQSSTYSGRLCFRFLGAPLQDCQFRLGWRIGFRRWSPVWSWRWDTTFGYIWLLFLKVDGCFQAVLYTFNHVGFSMGQHTHIRFRESHTPGPASLQACHSWFESLWETQTRRADGGFRSSGAMVLGWFLRWDESDTADWCVAGGIGKPLVAVVLDEF